MSSTYTPADARLDDITIPDDGDDLNAASVNTALQPLADNVYSLNLRAPMHLYAAKAGDEGTYSACSDKTPPTTIASITASSWTLVTGLTLDLTGCEADDCLEVEASLEIENMGSSSDGNRLRIEILQDSSTTLGTGDDAAGAYCHLDVASGTKQHVHLHGYYWLNAPAATVRVHVLGRTTLGAGEQFNVMGGAILIVRHYKALWT